MFELVKGLERKIFRKKLISCKFVHIMVNDKFSRPFIEFINENFSKKDQCFIFFRHKVEKFDLPIEYENVVVVKNQKRLEFDLEKIEKIFIHSLPSSFVRFLYNRKSLLKYCYWIVWGYDIYCDENERSQYVKNNVKAVITNFDKITYQKKYNMYKPIYEFPFYPSVIKKEYLDALEKTNGPLVIQINNSADPSTLEILETLSKFEDKDLRVVTILSYGETQYNEEIIKKGQDLFKNKFLGITDYLSVQNYAEHIKNVDILILNQKRQQGVGNIRCSFYVGNKVFIRGEITTYQGFKNKGFKVFDTNEIQNMDFEEFILFDDRDRKNNKKLVEGYFDNSDVIASWQYFFSDKTD